MSERMGFRKWLAWMLQRLAAKVYYAEWEETITLRPPSGADMTIHVTGDEYGCGIGSTSGIFWDGKEPMTADVGGFQLVWSERRKVDLSDD